MSYPLREQASGQAQMDEQFRRQLVTHGCVGNAPLFLAALRQLHRFASACAPLLITGETGTGKDLAARCAHSWGPRSQRPFVPVNCAALTESLFEAELFGHSKGAFTDARSDRQGLVELADGGTLFLDEIDSLSLKCQAALLRFLQDRSYRPVGGRQLRQADVVVIAATNADLLQRVGSGQFRADLYYRLDVARVELPPLRQRRDDILPLCRHLLARLHGLYHQGPSGVTTAAAAWLEQQPWPGNIRELENRLHRAFLLCTQPHIDCADLGAIAPPPAVTTVDGYTQAKASVVADFERSYLCQLLTRTRGNLSAAARLAGKERKCFSRLLRRHGISRQDYAAVG